MQCLDGDKLNTRNMKEKTKSWKSNFERSFKRGHKAKKWIERTA